MEPRRSSGPPRVAVNPAVVLVIGLLVTALFVTGLMLLWSRSTYDYWGALVVGPVLLLVSLPILARQARREQDPRLFWILAAALTVKLLASMVRAYVRLSCTKGRRQRDQTPGGMAGRFLSGDFGTGLETLTETNFIKLLTGGIPGDSPPSWGGSVCPGWGSGGCSCSTGRSASPCRSAASQYAYLVFFLPSLLYWPSGLGKEAWMTLVLGIAAYGAARIFAGSTVVGLGIAAAGLFLASVVRAHFAGLFAVALALGYLFRRSKPEYRQLAPVAKALGVVALVAVAGYFVVQTQSFFESAGLQVEGSVASVGGISSVLEQASEQTGQGGPSSIRPTCRNQRPGHGRGHRAVPAPAVRGP